MDKIAPNSLKLVGACYGDPWDPRTLSGSPFFLFNALERRHTLVKRVDYRLSGWRRGLALAVNFRYPRARWQHRYHRNHVAHALRSRRLQSALDDVGQPFDLAVQVYGWTDPHHRPYVLYVDSTWHLEGLHWPAWLPTRHPGRLARWQRVERRMLQGADHLFASNTPAAESLIAFYDVPPDRVTVVGGGANFDPLPAIVEHSGQNGTILFVGRDFRRKGGDILLDAFRLVRAEMPEAHLTLVGCNETPTGPGVQSVGDVGNREEMARLYRQAALFCLPSRYDPFPNSILEAMAHGLPVVSTAVSGIPEAVVNQDTGLLVRPNDSASLARALLRLLRDSDYARELGAAGRRRVETQLTWDAVVQRMGPGLAMASELAQGAP